MGYPVVDVTTFPVEMAAVKVLPFAMAERLAVMPLMLREGRLVVAMEDPTKRTAISEMEFTTQTKVVATLARLGTVLPALPEAYRRHGLAVAPTTRLDTGGIDGSTLLAQMQADADDVPAEAADEQLIEQSDNQLVRLINTMIIEAQEQGVSDIHIECPAGKEKIRVRFRKDGQLKLHLELPPSYRSALVARIKIMCDLDISERRRAQDGKINFAKFSPQHKLELRVATIPTANGVEDVVMRLLAASKPLPLDGIGLSPNNYKRLTWAIERPYGMVLCVGPTGSGKTTTLHSALGFINRPETKIWTAEDPVEITQVGLRQVQVNAKIDWTFAKALKSFLRADPDVIMVGEIRDAETAHMAIEASLTGHMVMSTLHTNSAPETVTRLLDMGMDPFNFADSLLAVLAQRLGKRLCKDCKVSAPATQEQIDELLDDFMFVYTDPGMRARDEVLADWMSRFAVDGHLMHFHSPGCDKCEQRGFRGRVGLHELMSVSRAIRGLIQKGARAEEIQHQALREGMLTLRQDGIEKVLQGLTSLEDVRAMSNN
jgi:type II secretory ATPase GspE/PulE/Tfp pilus assembly ATPase PilB-like protein